MIALLVVLGLAGLLSLQPWAANSVNPQLSVAPDLGVALGDSVAVSRSRELAVAPAQPATGATPRLIAAGVAAEEGESQPRLGIAAARPVASPRPNTPPASSPESPQAESPPEAEPAPAPVAVPVAAPAPAPAPSPEPVVVPPAPVASGGGSPGPVGAGGGPVGGAGAEAVEVHDGDERALSFSFYVQPTAYRAPEDENLILQVRGPGSESPSFGLQLWDDSNGAQRGLWASGSAMGGERFLAPVEEGMWHEVVFCFQASNDGDGFYLLLLDGQPIDARAWVSLIAPGSSDAQIEVGLFREGQLVVGSADVLFDPMRLGDTLEAVLP